MVSLVDVSPKGSQPGALGGSLSDVTHVALLGICQLVDSVWCLKKIHMSEGNSRAR